MTSRLLTSPTEKTFAIVFKTEDEAVESLRSFASDNKVTAAHFTGIGGFSDVVLGYYDWKTKTYVRLPVQEQVELVSLIGDITLEKDKVFGEYKPMIHAHAVVAKRDGLTVGGHLLEAHVRPTLELVLTESPVHLTRKYDEESGLALIKT
jgi:predicted DNA-binding protein with PD1-like motif